MRIVAGKFRAKKLTPPSHNIRPTLDKVKQALFTRLQFFVPNAKVLDLFCGSGALGIEAISRGASLVVFCDANDKSIALTKKNVGELKLKPADCEISIIKSDYLVALAGFKNQFDLIILDPPYESDFYLPALQKIAELNLLADGGVLVTERLRAKPLTTNLFTLTATKEYGTVALDYFEKLRV